MGLYPLSLARASRLRSSSRSRMRIDWRNEKPHELPRRAVLNIGLQPEVSCGPALEFRVYLFDERYIEGADNEFEVAH